MVWLRKESSDAKQARQEAMKTLQHQIQQLDERMEDLTVKVDEEYKKAKEMVLIDRKCAYFVSDVSVIVEI